jgi:hypothetical protein
MCNGNVEITGMRKNTGEKDKGKEEKTATDKNTK